MHCHIHALPFDNVSDHTFAELAFAPTIFAKQVKFTSIPLYVNEVEFAVPFAA